MKTIKGDLIELAKQGRFGIIAHGCNCFNTMGAGIARQIAIAFPRAAIEDAKTKSGDKSKLGTVGWSCSFINGEGDYITIANCYTQYDPGRHFNYKAIRSCMREMKKYIAIDKATYSRQGITYEPRIGLPKIGAGIAGGDWDKISEIIEEELQGEDFTIVEYDK